MDIVNAVTAMLAAICFTVLVGGVDLPGDGHDCDEANQRMCCPLYQLPYIDDDPSHLAYCGLAGEEFPR